MLSNPGEDTFDALLFLGDDVEIADDGSITTVQAFQTLRGKAPSGSIEWADRSAMFHIRERAYIACLRAPMSARGIAQRTKSESPCEPLHESPSETTGESPGASSCPGPDSPHGAKTR